MNKPLLIGALLGALLLVGGGVWLAWPPDEPEPPVEALADQDTGMTRFETEELMRTIGYIQ